MALTECNAPDKSLTVNSLQGKEWNSSFMCINMVGLHFSTHALVLFDEDGCYPCKQSYSDQQC